jgi:hypothetical protein
MEIIYEGLHEFDYGTLSRVSIGLVGINEGLMPHGHLFYTMPSMLLPLTDDEYIWSSKW